MPDSPTPPEWFPVFAEAYRQQSGLELALVTEEGELVAGQLPCGCSPANPDTQPFLQRLIAETARWGEPFIDLCPCSCFVFAVPLMQNRCITGGLIASAPQSQGSEASTSSLRAQARLLLEMAERENLTNGAYLELKRRDMLLESRRAEAIHQLKGRGYDSIRQIYLREESGLISAIKTGDRGAAREILNRVLVGIYFFGRTRPELLKSFILELVVTMSRSAVEAGGDPSELLGVNYSSVTDLAGIDGEEDLSRWLTGMLERIMDGIRRHQKFPTSVLLNTAIAYMEEHLDGELSRDEVAQVACLSPSHFSRVVKETFGKSFTDLLTEMRVERSRQMLAASEKNVAEIALDCGFSDQSYFTKVFQKSTGVTPSQYRQRARMSLR